MEEKEEIRKMQLRKGLGAANYPVGLIGVEATPGKIFSFKATEARMAEASGYFVYADENAVPTEESLMKSTKAELIKQVVKTGTDKNEAEKLTKADLVAQILTAETGRSMTTEAGTRDFAASGSGDAQTEESLMNLTKAELVKQVVKTGADKNEAEKLTKAELTTQLLAPTAQVQTESKEPTGAPHESL